MKKLMIVAATAAMTVVGSAALKPSVCVNCGASGSACDTIVFKVTGSGKAIVDKGAYKVVDTLKIKKGALALEGTLCETDGNCCYEEGMFYATVKAGKTTFRMAAPVTLGVWSVFGKSLDTVRDVNVKPGKSLSLDSALFVTAEEADADEVDLSEFYLWASAFGKVNVKFSKGTSGYCKDDKPCEPTYTPKTYNGWFVGTYPCVNEEDCFLCDCTDTDVFGGTWKAVYQAGKKSDAAAQALAGVSYDDDED